MLDNFRRQHIQWDYANKEFQYKIEGNSGDTNGRVLYVQLLDNNLVPDVTGATLSLAWHSESNQGLDAFTTLDAKKGQFEIYFTTDMLTNIGTLKASLVLIDSTGRIESQPFDIVVRRGIVDDEAVQSENSFTALTEALVKVSQMQEDFDGLYNEKEKMLDELATAKGKAMDDLHTEKETKLDKLHTDEKAELDALENDYSERAGNLEENYVPRLTAVEARTNGLGIDADGDIAFNDHKLVYFVEEVET